MEFLSQFNAKIVYIKGDENSVADALSHMPTDTDSSTANTFAQHPYDFCKDDDTLCIVASISSQMPQGPWEMMKALLTSPTSTPSICTTLEIAADKSFLDAIKSGYPEDPCCKTLPSAALSLKDLHLHDEL